MKFQVREVVRRRRWTVATCALFLALITAASCPLKAAWCVQTGGTAWELMICRGAFAVCYYRDTMPQYPSMVPDPGWTLDWEGWHVPIPIPLVTSDSPPSATWGMIPLSWFVLGLGAMAIWGFRAQHPKDGCRVCGYARTGLASDAACPECGEPPKNATPPRRAC
jgi:hypothetical protein